MTIKEFARLCGCNPQTLRYYDHVDLLKPVKVDQWSGYRYYEEEQAQAFVKIKNLQKAGFTIDEIKGLLDADNAVIFRAFEAKIAEGERRLQEIRELRQSYQTEMNEIRRKIDEVREKVMEAMRRFDPVEEFGISAEEYAAIVGGADRAFADLSDAEAEELDYREYRETDAVEEDRYLNLLEDPAYEVVYEKHGWAHVKDFLWECGTLSDGEDYALQLLVEDEKEPCGTAMAVTILGMLLAGNPGKKKNLSCNIENTSDGQNHFWLLRQKA